jgi:hypothetical protein
MRARADDAGRILDQRATMLDEQGSRVGRHGVRPGSSK